MPISLFKRRILKISGYVLGTIAVLLTSFHFWFINHAEQMLEELVASRSNGKLKLHVKKFRFNWFSDNMQLRNAVFYSTDTATASTSYRLSVTRINIRVKELWPLIFEKRILIDSLELLNSDIQVTRLRPKDTDTDTTIDRSLSLPLEMGRVYNSIQDALQVLQVNRFQIDNGKFSLKVRPDAKPVTITNIFLHLDNLQVDTNNTTGKKKILFSDNVSLRTYNQNIDFPDGRHHISFSNFHINIFNKMVEFDSCTISATKGDSTKSSFKIFFDKLLLKNIDFDTLYQKEVIKADSVFCINPHFRLDVELAKRTGKRKSLPRLDELIQLLTGDMRLGFVAVKDGSFDINTMREGRPSSFTSYHNNFEMTGLSIDKDAPRHLNIESFAMAIRNYENFLRDSAYAMVFDSILVVNNSVLLSNFSVKQMQNDNVINSFTMPQFELKGLSWDDLVFDGRLSAEKATLHRPVINYTVRENKNKRQNIFKTLSQIGEAIEINGLDIDNGQINIHFPGGGQLQLENTSMSVLSENLVESNRISDLQRSVRRLKFRKGLLKLNGVEVKIENGDFGGDNGSLAAEKIIVTNQKKDLLINAKKIAISQMMIGDNAKIDIDGMKWQEADIRLVRTPSKKKQAFDVDLKNIQGINTKLAITSGQQTFNTFLETVSAGELLLEPDKKPVVNNLHAGGKQFSFSDRTRQLTTGRFAIADHQNSEIHNLVFKSISAPDSTSIMLPDLLFTPDIGSLINGKIISDNVTINMPRINIHLSTTGDATGAEKKFPVVAIGKIMIRQPEIDVIQTEAKQFSKLSWKAGELKDNFLEVDELKVTEHSVVSADKIHFSLNNFSFTANGKKFNTGTGEIKAMIDKFYLEPATSGESSWRGTLADLHANGLSFDSIGAKHGRLEITTARLNSLALNSASFTRLRQLVKENNAFEINEITGHYVDSANSYTWLNANYNRLSKTFSVDSFSLHPTVGRDSFIAKQPYQTDYITLRTGALRVNGFDPDRYLADTILDVANITIEKASMTVFRDKRSPFKVGVVKPLPTMLIKQLPVKFSADTIRVVDANVEYSELNDKTNQTGSVYFNRLNGRIFPVINYGLRPRDSLTLNVGAWLMDSIKIKLHIKESYTDSLGGFLMEASISPGDPKLLNPALVPLASFQLHSGMLDTVSLRATATDYVAIGEMKMFYHDLKIEFLNTKKEKNKKFLSFLANLFVRKNNRSATGIIFWERLRDRSFLNYLVKITASGASSSAGIKNNKKLLRKYKKDQRKRNLPAKAND